MTDWNEWEDEQFNRRAVELLVERHRDEYDELRGVQLQGQIAALERLVRESVDQINHLRKQNPDGVSVPSLTETANILASENDDLHKLVRKLEGRVDKLTKENRNLRELVADS